MNKQEYIEEIRDTLTLCAVNGMHLGEVNKAFVKIKTEKIFLLFLDMAESMMPKFNIEEARKHIPYEAVGFILGWNTYDDQFKEKIEELRGGENNE